MAAPMTRTMTMETVTPMAIFVPFFISGEDCDCEEGVVRLYKRVGSFVGRLVGPSVGNAFKKETRPDERLGFAPRMPKIKNVS